MVTGSITIVMSIDSRGEMKIFFSL